MNFEISYNDHFGFNIEPVAGGKLSDKNVTMREPTPEKVNG
jgi:hypothetical protein